MSAGRDLLLGGDVGGTKTNLGLFAAGGGGDGGGLHLLRAGRYASADHAGLAPIVGDFLRQLGEDGARVGAACFGVAGPVLANRTRLPNLAWEEIDGDGLARTAGIPRVTLVNDLVATAEGIVALAPADLAVLQAGDGEETAGAEPGPRALIAAGTGLGMTLLPWVDGRHVPIPSEGGHMDFAPRNDAEMALAVALRRQHGRVSIERIVSGPGLHNIYRELPATGDGEEVEVPEVLARFAAGEDPSQVIAEAALAGVSRRCRRALDLFAAAYGAAAGNLALVGLATGGVYLGGGIAPKILPELRREGGAFLTAFADKGRFRPLLAAMPIRVVLNDRAAMLGAARVAARLLGA